MNDDLYGHELKGDERVVFSGHADRTKWGTTMIATLIVMFLLIPKAAEDLGTHAPESDFTLIVGVFLFILFMLDRLDGVFRSFRAAKHLRPAVVTNQRVIAPNGLDIPLSNISKVHGRWSTVKLDGQKLADGLTIRDMQDARAFRTAIERQLA